MPQCHLIAIFVFGALLQACSWQQFRENVPGIYSMDIHQGNIVSQEMVDQLRPGMNKRQVLFVMGTPLLQDPFHEKRWDYLYSNEPNGKVRLQKRITLVFDEDELAGLQGDFRPGNLPSIEPPKDVTMNVPKISREKTLWESIASLFGKE